MKKTFRISVLRLGHRFMRDKRISTHLALVARAFGANELIFDAIDEGVNESIHKVVKKWGGNFNVSFVSNWKEYIEKFSGEKIHLTMYGIPVEKKIGKIRKSMKDKLIVIGGKKVPSEIYHLVDYNISITQQPHSEVAALAIFLDRLFEGRELKKSFRGWEKKIVPKERGKKVLNREII